MRGQDRAVLLGVECSIGVSIEYPPYRVFLLATPQLNTGLGVSTRMKSGFIGTGAEVAAKWFLTTSSREGPTGVFFELCSSEVEIPNDIFSSRGSPSRETTGRYIVRHSIDMQCG